MIFQWYCTICTRQVTIFVCLILRSSTTSQESQYHSKIDTTTQDQLPRAASELKCSLASSSKPILLPPQSLKPNRDSNVRNNRPEEEEMNGKCGVNKKSHISKDNKKEEKDKGCGYSEDRKCSKSKTSRSSNTSHHEKVKRNCRRWNNLFGQVICTTWRFTVVDKIGPYVSFPNLPSPTDFSPTVQKNQDQLQMTVKVTEVKCRPPFKIEVSTSQHKVKNNEKDQRNLPLVHDEQNLLGSSYHKLELNFLFAGQKK